MIQRLTESQMQREYKPGTILKLSHTKYKAAPIPDTVEGYTLEPMKVSGDFSVGFNSKTSMMLTEDDIVFLLDVFFVKDQYDRCAKIVTFLLEDKSYYCSLPSYTFTVELFDEV